jgi:hypothetical protein
MMLARSCSIAIAAALLGCPLAANALTRCEAVLQAFGSDLADATCYEKNDLTTNGDTGDVSPTTPADNASLPGLPSPVPLFAFTPRTDRAIWINALTTPPSDTTPITKIVPGLQINARIASDPKGQARFLLRLPNNWNGRLVVSGTASQRSEFTNDFAWSDYVLQKGYAYASQNKGMLNAQLTTATDPLGCRLFPGSTTFVHYYANDPGLEFPRWTDFMVAATVLARTGTRAAYGSYPTFTYAVGGSNGGYQVRRALEVAPNLYDGGVDWEGTEADASNPGVLTDLPPAVLNYPDYLASNNDPNSTAAKNILLAGYPPDVGTAGATAAAPSMWGRYYLSYWEVTACQWQKRLDPTYDTYGSGLSTYNYNQRKSFSNVGQNVNAFATTGRITAPLITIAGTLDALLPIDHHARSYARKVRAAAENSNVLRSETPEYRLYEVQNGNHIENYKTFYPQIEYILPHAQKSFDLMVSYVESGAALPPDQCIPRGGAISGSPTQAGHCAAAFVP